MDPLLSNNIEGMDAYQWMMKRREEVNYKDMDFHDPFPPEFWQTINEELQQQGIKNIIDKLVNDNWLYCFQEEYAVLGIPTKRLILTVDEIHKYGKKCVNDDKMRLVNELVTILSDNAKRALEIWFR